MLDRFEKWSMVVALVVAPIGLVFSAVNGEGVLAFGFGALLVGAGLQWWAQRRREGFAEDAPEWTPELVRDVVDGTEGRVEGVRRIRVADRSLSLLDAVRLYDDAVPGR